MHCVPKYKDVLKYIGIVAITYLYAKWHRALLVNEQHSSGCVKDSILCPLCGFGIE